MEIWHYWIIAALLLFVVELFTQGFAVICLAIGAAGSAIGSACGLGFEMQLVVFAIVTLISIALVRPLLKRMFHIDKEKVATNVSAMVGRRGKVVVAISQDDGRVMIDGVDWKARSVDGGRIEVGTKVEVVKMESIILIVKKL